uniref:Uncharacterized protein n=1 Tax=Anguilla anguilla TaxID=7936 RepID=A0A0E9TSK2_ANGAN
MHLRYGKKWTVIAVICNKFLHNYITDHLVSSCVSNKRNQN